MADSFLISRPLQQAMASAIKELAEARTPGTHSASNKTNITATQHSQYLHAPQYNINVTLPSDGITKALNKAGSGFLKGLSNFLTKAPEQGSIAGILLNRLDQLTSGGANIALDASSSLARAVLYFCAPPVAVSDMLFGKHMQFNHTPNLSR